MIGDPQVWGAPYWDDEYMAYNAALMDQSDALLLGRATYEGFAASWPQRSGNPFTDKINAMPEHVASRTLTDLTWNATVLQGDAATAVAALKAQPGGALLKYGTGEFDRTLLEHDLVDEYHLWLFPGDRGRRPAPGRRRHHHAPATGRHDPLRLRDRRAESGAQGVTGCRA